MQKRPLCVLCCCFILLTILLTVSGLPVPWQEQIPSGLSQTMKDGAEGCLYGQLYRIQEKSSGCTLYIKNSILVVRSNRYSLNNSKIIYDKVPEVRIGNSLCVFGKVSLLQKATNPGQFDAAAYEQVRHISVQMKAALVEVTDNSVDWLSEAARRLQASMGAQFDKGLTEQESGVLKTMLLGDKADLDAEIRQLYQKGGISHILAISGMHISLLGMGVYRLLRKCLGNIWSSVLSGSFLFFYLILTGWSVSAQRAVFMFWLHRGAECAGRTYDEPTALSLAALVVLGENPLYIFDSGFLLSFGAAFFLWMLKQFKVEKRAFSLYFWLCMLPFTACFYYEISFVGIVLNLLILPPLGCILFLGIMGGLAGMVSSVLGTALLLPVEILLKMYTLLARLAMQVPFGSLLVGRPPVWQLILYGAGLFGLLLFQRKNIRGKPLLCGLSGSFLVLFLIFRLPSPLSVSMLDVGQGDCLVIQKGSSAVLVDGGSTSVKNVGQYRIVPYLRYKGIRTIRSIILTHPDGDHMNGLCELLEMRKTGELSSQIEQITVPEWMRESAEWEKMQTMAGQQEIPVVYTRKGDTFRFGSSIIRVLHPDIENYGKNTNAGSLTFLLQTNTFTMLFTGDLEGEGEQAVCRENIRCDVLKVAHHGSANSSSCEFLEKTDSSIALISCGEGNRYGHPHKDTLERLQAAGCEILCTMDSGQITIKAKQKGIWIEKFRKEDP